MMITLWQIHIHLSKPKSLSQKRKRIQQSVEKPNDPTARSCGASDSIWSTISPVEQANERGIWCPEFSEETGLKLNTDEFEPLDYFGLYLYDAIHSSIVEETNRYAMQKTDSATHPFARLKNLSQVTINELHIFFAMQIIMGLKRLPEISDYWSRYWVFHDLQFVSLSTLMKGVTYYTVILVFKGHFDEWAPSDEGTLSQNQFLSACDEWTPVIMSCRL